VAAVGLAALAVSLPGAWGSVRAEAGADAKPAGINPSAQAKMVCAPDAQSEISASLGVQAVQVTTPTWINHVYSCRYVYTNGAIVLSVKELPNASSTTRYFNELGKRLGRRPQPLLRGQGAFFTTNYSVIVRKDFKVLEVDSSRVPAQFGDPTLALDPAQVALNVTATILKCWPGG
jgi:hypothetical protein